MPSDGRFPICGSWRSNWNHTGDAERATCPQCRVRLAAVAAPRTVSVVHVDTGLIVDQTSETLTSDVPADLAEQATEASIDTTGHLHYVGLDGRAHVCDATTRKLGDRAPSDVCLLPAPTMASERTGWSLLDVCVLEPATTHDEIRDARAGDGNGAA